MKLTLRDRSFYSIQRLLGGMVVATSLLLAGCASLTPPAEQASTTESANGRTYHDAIGINGRLSVQYQRNGSDESLHGSFTWKQGPSQSRIAMLSPLGQIIATIETGPNGARLIESGKAPIIANDVDALAAQTLGWPLPVAGLRQWLQGFAIDANGKKWVAGGAGTSVQTQDGWQIRYVTWQDDGNRPRRIDLQRQTQEAGRVEIRIVIDEWQPQ